MEALPHLYLYLLQVSPISCTASRDHTVVYRCLTVCLLVGSRHFAYLGSLPPLTPPALLSRHHLDHLIAAVQVVCRHSRPWHTESSLLRLYC